MAACPGLCRRDLFPSSLYDAVSRSKILVVGAGGIGCELIKNLVLSGFQDIDIVDLDTIDVSNLNRQFLFQKKHVGKSKAKVAQESAKRINPEARITAHHASITSSEFSPDYFKQFTVVLNALDNRAARNHVNRMCLAADIPLVESGSAGYLGQVTVIKKGKTECYECEPKPPQKTYPGCTIRNTPSEPIHCVVWAKHLFNQLFGEADPDEDVSPDTADPEAVGDAGANALSNDSNMERVSTHAWAIKSGFNADKLLHKLFHDDIKYLLSMDRLWIKRRPPIPLDFDNIPDAVAGPSRNDGNAPVIRDQRIWSIKECTEVFKQTIDILKVRFNTLSRDNEGELPFLIWDKDDDPCMDFVTACANIRSHVFGIQQKSRFDVKSMAGNIIPAIATTNAVIAGLIVMETFKILEGRFDECCTVYLNEKPNALNKLMSSCVLMKPNPKCAVCSPKPEIALKVDVDKFTLGNLANKVLKGHLNMVAPDVIEEGKGKVLISSEEGETDENNDKKLSEFGIVNGTRLCCDDFLQTYNLIVTIVHSPLHPEGQEFEVVGDLEQLTSKPEEPSGPSKSESPPHSDSDSLTIDDDDLIIVNDDLLIATESQKRPLEDAKVIPPKRQKK